MLLCIFFLFQIHRVTMGRPSSDEQLYISVPFRLLQGDLLFVDDWHGTQLMFFLLIPIVKFYLIIN